jgi:glycosyltransferase involved in cell wall biosynthesis
MLSIVIPAYYEEKNIGHLYGLITEVLDPRGSEFELIFVDDGSGDGTFAEISRLAAEDPRVRGIQLSRNFGHQVALLAGLNEAGGQRILMMDADGQHPPERIPDLLEKLNEGYDIVNTVREATRDAGVFKKSSSRLFYRVFNALSDVKIETDSSDFRIMTREALDAFLNMEEQNRFTRGMVSWMGFRQGTLSYVAPPRHSGRSKYSPRRMIRFAFDGVTAFSSKPLRISAYLGLIVLVLGFAYAVYALVVHLLGRSNPGWTSLMITILVLGGTQLLILGIVGEYMARIFNETKRRPHYFISRRTGK